MSKIRILPEQLANQIAAGEVVERPASVIKELLENSLDAGATTIVVEVEGGGTRLLKILDNGEGMDEDDILLSMERHGTSKITSADDLAAISTLGFRGEAIPSIGAVSILTITSRTKESELGNQAVLKYGKLQKVHETGAPKGTTIEVRNLFGNTPARRKFLRTVRTEIGHIEEVVKNYALVSEGITFILRINGKETLHLAGAKTLEMRLKQLMSYDSDLLPVAGKIATTSRSVKGFLIPPDKLTGGASKLRVFVNNRAVKDRMINHAVNEGLRGFMMKGKHPAGMLHISLPAEEIDVNVHPAKHEIRFRNGSEVHQMVTMAVAKSMETQQLKLRTDLFGNDYIAPPPEPDITQPTKQKNPENKPVPTPINFTAPIVRHEQDDKASSEVTPTRLPTQWITQEKEEPYWSQKAEDTPLQTAGEKQTKRPLPTPETVAQHHGFNIIGQLKNLYILCENETGLCVIDQHAAHERLLYEKLKTQFTQGRMTSQTLLFPETVELSIFQVQLVEKNLESLEQMGFSLRDFGGNTFVISAIPALVGSTNATHLFMDILNQFGNEKSSHSGESRFDDILADMACKAAVKAGHDLSFIEMESLLTKMAEADLFSHCPHGRPVVKQFTENELKKWFYRS